MAPSQWPRISLLPSGFSSNPSTISRSPSSSASPAIGVRQEPSRAASNDDEAFTYNKRVNRLATVQEHYMIVKAIERGVSEDKLARALNVDIKRIKTKRTLLDGVCPEVAEMLKDKSVDTDVFTLLRKMKPMRQIEAVELMLAMNNHTARYAHALLAATRREDLVQPKKIPGLSAEQMARMEREMDGLQREFKTVSASYGDTVLNLVVASGYLSSLIGNSRVSRYLERHHPEILTEFKAIVASTSLEESASGASEEPAFLG
jgi:RepB plasmid partitioning protein